MLRDGFKQTIISTHPHAIVADVDVLCRAPYELTAAGFSDMLGKLNSRVDWQFSHMMTGEYYCEFFVELIDEVVNGRVGEWTPTIPEPTSLAIWSVLGLSLTARWRRGKR